MPLIALNEVFVGRGAIGRLVKLDVRVDGVRLEQFRADGVIVASPTGSTAYALAAGGPIVGPDVDAFVVVAVAAQTTPLRAVVVPASRTIEVTIEADHDPVLSSDGLLDVSLRSGDTVVVRRSEQRAHFLRAHRPEQFYGNLAAKLR
jgi:NAD+ kinase